MNMLFIFIQKIKASLSIDLPSAISTNRATSLSHDRGEGPSAMHQVPSKNSNIYSLGLIIKS